MAKIDMKAVRRVLNGDTCQATVGNNRTVFKTRDGFGATLHGSEIVILRDGNPRVLFLHPRGYHTTTTRQAMQDLGAALTGVPVSVSFAKGGFTARVGGQDLTPNADGYIVASL